MEENPGTLSVGKLLESVDQGNYVIPYFQRGFEWEPGLVCDLFESILQEYYTGLILLWELNRNQAENEKWDPLWGSRLKGVPEVAILDGQQRLSSLYYAIYNPKKHFPGRFSYYLFYINITKILNDDYDDAITYKFFSRYQDWRNLKEKEKNKWVEDGIFPLCILSAKDPNDQKQKYIDSIEFEEILNKYLKINSAIIAPNITTHRIYQIFNKILNYNFIIYPLSSDRNVRDICNIFTRVNSKGMKLSTFDLMNAFLYPKGIKLRKELWENLENDKLKNIDKNMNEYLLKLISLKLQNYCSSKYIFNLIPGEEIIQKNSAGEKVKVVLVSDSKTFHRLWENSCKSAEKAREIIMNVGPKNFGSIKQDFIPNSTIIPVLGAIVWEYEEYKGNIDDIEFRKKIAKWYWPAVFSEDYSGSSDTVMARDFRDLKNWINNHENNMETIKRVTREYIEEINFKEVKKGSARYNAIISIIALNSAKDFYKGIVLGTGDFSNENINDHHIFPVSVKGIDQTKSKTFKESKDSILNRTLLFDETNIKISNKRPSEYIAELKLKYGSEEILLDILKTHLINEKAFQYLLEDNFDDFINEREKEIKKHIINIIEKSWE